MAHIIVNDVTPVDSYTANSNQVDFTVSYPFFTDQSLQVFKTPAGQAPDDAADLLTLTANYTVTGAGNVAGVTRKITLTSGAAQGDKIVIRRNEPFARTTDIQEQGDFLSVTYNDEQDLVIMLLQQVNELVGRSIERGVTGGDWEAQNTPIKNVGDPTSAQDAVTLSYFLSSNPSYFSAVNVQNIINSDLNKSLVLADANSLFDINRTVLWNLTIPADSTQNFPIGTTINFANRGTNYTNLNAAVGVSLYQYSGASTPVSADKRLSTGGVCTIQKISANTWAIFGNTGLVNQ